MKSIKSLDWAKIYYDSNIVDTSKPSLVFIHGLGGDAKVWKKEIEFFKSEGIQSISIDLRGHGNSERSGNLDFYKFENFVNDVKEIIKAENLESYSLVGHCLGGMISLAIASEKITGLKNLVLIDSIYKTPRIVESFDNIHLLKSFLNFFVGHAPDLKLAGREDYQSFKGTGNFNLERGLSDILHVSLRGYLLICENLLGTDATSLLSKIFVPTLIIEGEKDSVVPVEVAGVLKERIKNSELDMIPGANHFLIVNNPLHVS